MDEVDGGAEVAMAGGLFSSMISLALIILIIVAWWKVFSKAGKPGWASIIPFYNLFVLLDIAGKPWWWFFLFFVPCLNIVFTILLMISVAKSFGKSALFGIGLTFLGFIFFPILAFGDAEYVGPQE